MKKSFLSILTAFFLFLGIALPVHAADSVTVSFTTDADNYKQSDTVSVTGTVLKGTSAGKGTNPTLQVKNSSGKTVETFQWKDTQIGSNGSISTTIKPKKYVDDTYTVRLSASGANAVTKTIVISGEEIPTTPDPAPPTTPDPGTPTPDPGTTTPDPGTTTPDPGTTTPEPGTPTPNPGTTKPEPTPTPTPTPGDIIPKPPVNPTPPVEPSPVPNPSVKPYAPKVNTVTTVSTVITGTADAGTTVIISDRKNFRVWADANSSGIFSIELSEKLKAGMKLYATAKAGEIESNPTELVVLDATPPAAPSVNMVSDKDTKVSGSAEVGSTVTIKAGNKTFTGTAANGLFSIKITSQKAGTVLSITVKDQAGNISSTKRITVLDKTAPKAPSVSTVTDKNTRVTGTSEAGAKITIKSGKKLIGSETADKKGKFTVKIKLQKAGTVLAVAAADKAGNMSKSKTVKVLDKTAPKAPSINAVKKTATKVTGKAEAGVKVYVKVGKKVIGSATVSKKGAYSVKIKKQKAGIKLAVYAKDQAGNTGKTRTVTVKK